MLLRALLVVLLVAAIAVYIENHERVKWLNAYNAVSQGERNNAQVHRDNLKAAATLYADEMQGIGAQYMLDLAAARTVRLCTPTADLPAGGSAKAGSGTVEGSVSQLPGSDTGLRPADRAGPDIYPLLRRLALGADAVGAALREQQTVK